MNRARPTIAAAALLLSLGGAGPAGAEQVALEPLRDTTIYSEGELGNGAGDFLFAGVTGDTGGGAQRRALLAFDVAGAVPPGAVVTGATLTLTVTMSVAGPQPVSLHRLLAAFGEGTSDAPNAEGMGTAATTGDATWTQRIVGTAAWTAPGGDFAAAASADANVPDRGAATWGSTPALVADVQAWIDDPSRNFGWIAIGNENARTTAKRFASRENPQTAARPRLVVDFQPAAVASPTPTASPGPVPCTGDCNGSGDVGINELITGVNIVLGSTPLAACPSFDADGSGVVAINELIAAVNNALGGCR